ncbi:hypothetical protein Tco_0190232 [Tanacetum coccineum]
MAESSSHNPSSPGITPKEEHVSTSIGGIRGDVGINTFRNVLRAHYLPHASMYVSPPSITTTRPWFATIGYNGEIEAKGTLKKSFLPPRWRLLTGKIIQCLGREIGGLDQISNKDATILYCLANGALKPNQTEGPPFTDHMKSICNLDVLVDSKAPKPSSQTEEVPQEKETQSSSAKDKSPSHPLPPTPVVGEMHKEAQQATGHDASADSIAEADPVNSAPNDSIPSQQGTNEESRADEFQRK